eukprot:gene1225-biopygen18265
MGSGNSSPLGTRMRTYTRSVWCGNCRILELRRMVSFCCNRFACVDERWRMALCINTVCSRRGCVRTSPPGRVFGVNSALPVSGRRRKTCPGQEQILGR